MSAAAHPAVPDAAPPKAGKKKLIIIIVAAVLVLVLGGGAAFVLLKKKAPEDEGEDAAAGAPAAHAAAVKHDKGAPPVFVPLDPFTVNLADKDAERYAQVAVTLEIEDSHFGDQLKLYMPVIRNNILMLLAHKTATELLTREGKEKLARQILRESLRPLGFEMEAEAEESEGDENAEATPASKKKKKKKKAAAPSYPIKAVQFANFIIQ